MRNNILLLWVFAFTAILLNGCAPLVEQTPTRQLQSTPMPIPSEIPVTPTQTQTVAATLESQSTLSPMPSATPQPTQRPASWVLPDAELVYSPAVLGFDVADYLLEGGGLLAEYEQYLMITGWTSAAEIISRVALENSINPRVLLALLELQSGCVLGHPAEGEDFDTAMGADTYYRKDLYGQLIWAVHALSEGFYGWLDGSLSEISYPDGTILRPETDANAGSVAVQYFFAQLYDPMGSEQALRKFEQLYSTMFGDSWARVDEFGMLIPEGLEQPDLTLPFEPGRTWALTGGPHKAFEGNGPLAGLDFAPRMDVSGCVPSIEWVVAMTEGLIVRSEFGTVIQDLDGDGHEQTGWVLMYLHIATDERVPTGTYLQAGERVGHPSCEGGRATGTHVHIARKYNGVWMAADGAYPFMLDGWTAYAGDNAYLGGLTRGEDIVTAHQFGSAVSRITRDTSP